MTTALARDGLGRSERPLHGNLGRGTDRQFVAALRHIGERRNSIVIDRRKRSQWKPCDAALDPAMD
jgi:hypothetical protein